MEKLISMTDFVLEQERVNGGFGIEEADKIWNYTKFLKQPLTLGMFVPVNKHGNILNEPVNYSAYEVEMSGKDFNFNFIDCQEYQEATESRFFEGFTVRKQGHELMVTTLSDDNVWVNWNTSKIIEDLVYLKPILTESAKKQIGL